MKVIFITGATGYIGGDVLSQLIAKHPENSYRLLVRSEQSQNRILAAYPSVTVVSGGLDDLEIVARESARADIIIHTADAADHLPAAQAIAKGAIEGHSPDRPAYWLHTSGAGILSSFDEEDGTYGERSEAVYDDVKDIQAIISLPDHAMHRDVDKTVLAAGAKSPDVLKIAIISPTTVYGKGRGPCSHRSRQLYEMAKFILDRKRVPLIGHGRAVGSNIHVSSLTELFLRLFEEAVGGERDDLPWGAEAYYLVEQGEHCWGETARAIGRLAVEKGLLSSMPEPILIDKKTAYELAGFEATNWGNNMRCRATRARSILDWQPTGSSLDEELPRIVRSEFDALKKT